LIKTFLFLESAAQREWKVKVRAINDVKEKFIKRIKKYFDSRELTCIQI